MTKEPEFYELLLTARAAVVDALNAAPMGSRGEVFNAKVTLDHVIFTTPEPKP